MLNWHVFALEKMRIQLWFRSRICLLLLFFWCICFDLFICENLKELRRAPWMRRICVILSIGNLWNIFGLVACLSRYFEKLLRFSDIFGVFFAGVFQVLYIFCKFFLRDVPLYCWFRWTSALRFSTICDIFSIYLGKFPFEFPKNSTIFLDNFQ